MKRSAIISVAFESFRLRAIFSWRKRIHAKRSIAVFKKIKVGRFACAREVLARHADESASEIGKPRGGRLIGEDARVELLRQPAPIIVHAFDPIREMKSFVINFDT